MKCMGREMWIYKVTVQNSIALFRDYRNRLHVFILIILFEHLFKSSTWKNETLKLLTFDCRDSYQNLQIIRTKSLWELIFNIIKQFELRITCNLWKVSKYGVLSGPYFPALGVNTERYEISLHIHSECGKIRTRNNSVFGHFSRSDAMIWFKMNQFKALISQRDCSHSNRPMDINLSRPYPGRREKINLSSYFHTSFWCLKRLYEKLKGLQKNLSRHHKEVWK